MTVCAACGAENPGKAKFCMECAAPLAAPAAAAEERKTVTTLFCDLVGFTAMSEAADPEDVDRLLGEYFARATKVIESHGGTVEKFIGDAVVGVFGVPAAHEDDPERAVRAGLRIVQALEGMTRPDDSPLQVRVGVNTGEALVRLDVEPLSGRGFLTGDAVNVAARLQAAAPPGGVVVGALTHELSVATIVYEELPPVTAKGKSEPVTAWRARAPIARRAAGLDRALLSPLVGRAVELAQLTALIDGAVASSTPRFALLVGEPGIGKCRLIAELAETIDRRSEMATWRQGRCLPYGENATFSALAEIVRAHAGILEGADEATTQAALDTVLPHDEERAWMLNRLRALLGLEAPPATREESFAAWTRFLEALAERRPTVLIFEDVHWADEALLAFLGHLAARTADVPLVVLACTRPELFEMHAAFAGEGAGFDRISLRPLSRDETSRLVAALLLDTEGKSGAEIVSRCGGNPFFAEQSVRFVADAAQATSLPGSVQAVIAARLDALPAGQKALLGDAAVIGAVFWDGALAAVGERDPADVKQALDDLVARQLLRRVRTPTMGLTDVDELEFVHALARDVAYQQLPRAARARKHAAMARWLEEKAGDRPEDHAETLAHHYATALELARAADETDLAASAIAPAIRYLTAAGERVYNADLGAAERYYRAALDIAPSGAAGRAAIQARLGEAVLWSGRDAEAADLLAEAASGLRRAGDARRAAVALVCLARALENVAVDAQVDDLYRDAMALLEDDGPSPEMVHVLIECGRFEANADELELGLATLERALDAAWQIGTPEPALARNLRGTVLRSLGMPGYLADYRRSLDLAQQQGLGVERGRVWGNYCTFLREQEGPQRAMEEQARLLEFLESRGLASLVAGERAQLAESLLYAGRWDEAIAEADTVGPAPHAEVPAADVLFMRQARLLALSWLGEREADPREVESMLEASRASAHDVEEAFGLLIAGLVSGRSSPDLAAELLERMLATTTRDAGVWGAALMPEAARLAVRGSDLALAERLLGSMKGPLPVEELARRSIAPLLAEACSEYETAAAGFAAAAARWHDFGVPYEEGHALLGQGRCLAALGRAPEAAAPLAAAHEIFARLGARPALAETEEALRRSAAAAG